MAISILRKRSFYWKGTRDCGSLFSISRSNWNDCESAGEIRSRPSFIPYRNRVDKQSISNMRHAYTVCTVGAFGWRFCQTEFIYHRFNAILRSISGTRRSQVWDSHVKDKTVVGPSYLYHEDPYTGETICLYWDDPLGLMAAMWMS